MLKKLELHTLFLSAWHASFSKRLPWIFGLFLAIVGIAENWFGTTLPDAASFQEFLAFFTEKPLIAVFSLLLFFILLFGLEIFGRSNLIVSLSFVTEKSILPNHPISPKAIGKNFWRALLLECLTLLFLSVVVGILSLPYLIASSQNPEALDTLLRLGIIAFIPIAIVVFFIKQFALFYLLLSPLKLRRSLETGGALFSRFIFQSLLFGLFSFVLIFLFTFCVNAVILSLATLLEKLGLPPETLVVSSIVGLIFFTWFSIFQQALWLAFFKSIAGPHEAKELAGEKELALDNHTLPEIPPAQ